MAKGNRGGKRTSGVSGGSGAVAATQNANVQPQNVQVDNTQPAKSMGASYEAFMKMTDDQKADAIDTAVSQGVPAHLSQSPFQKFTYNSDMNDKPTVVDDSVLDSMNGTEIFRTVNNVYDSKTDLNYTAPDIANQVRYGTKTRYSDSGGSAYGRGLYFADDYGESVNWYGNTTGNIQKTAVMRAKLNANAKTIDISSVRSGLSREMASGSKLGKTLKKIYSKDDASAESIYALSKGYNVIISGSGYFNVLNRNAMTMSKTIHSKGSEW